MAAYYNEIDDYAARWLENAICAGVIAAGDVDRRSIRDVGPDDLRPYTQCHFFAGIGLWSVALRTAGWPDSEPVWTGSCPCQPFSAAGKRKGAADERHLWPEFHRLISARKPSTVFGEQVAGRDGRKWLSGVLSDLENVGYAVAGADLCAAGVGAPHIRQRLYWVADSEISRRGQGGTNVRGGVTGYQAQRRSARFAVRDPGDCGMGHANSRRRGGWQGHAVYDGQARGRPESQRFAKRADWGNNWVYCPDGKWRRVEPGIPLLANGVSARASKLRAAGNAIVPQVAAQFIAAFLECRP